MERHSNISAFLALSLTKIHRMQKTTFSLVLIMLICLSSSLFGQVSQKLQTALNQQPNSFQRIRVEFKDNVDCYALNHDFKQQRLVLAERSKIVITQLQEQAATSQTELVGILQSDFSTEIEKLQQFWIVNLLVLEASPAAIAAIAAYPTVALVDLENNTMIPHDPIVRGEEQHERSPNGIEPGLLAINAPAMWALGYTGRGRLVYDYDTGVWPTHPAFADRFLAHRFPMEQCWYGFFSNVPNGNISDHGTHTLGTMAGLVEATNDTIGVAYKSYWIANDFVTSTVEALPPLTNMIEAFEWALNPDENVATTHDIPDVINNSWRWRDDPDTVQCAGFVVNLMNAIEAAGIANIFSGGNSGPGNTTVNAPQRINTSEVNTFSVGSIDANQSYPYPISNFSTRGPTQCDYTGSLSLEIHPEVVAPGQNVRSAWGLDEYNTISGTSMAAPHVSGAILLLKEAFPYLSGEDLMWALYLTAIDFGDAGEDNVYGNGLIDVHAAYLYLAQTNTPVDPTDVPWDLAIVSATQPAAGGITCSNSFTTDVTVTNLGDNPIASINFEYSLDGATTQNLVWTNVLAPNQTETIALPVIATSAYGNLGISIAATIVGQPVEYDLYNNKWYMTFNRRTEQTLPFVEDFNYGFSVNDWLVQNDDGSTGWDTIQTSGLQWGGKSVSVQCYNYLPRDNQKDGMVTPEMAFPVTTEPIWMVFDVAYQKRTSNIYGHDTLEVQVSTDCGGSFANVVYNKAADELSTNDTVQLNFMPEFAWDWRRDSINLSAFAGESVLVRIESTNRKGNNIYIDNVKIFVGNAEPNSIRDLNAEVRIYPNPTSSTLYADVSENIAVEQVLVRDILGQQVQAGIALNGKRIAITTHQLTAGLYFLEIRLSEGTVTKRFVKN